MCTKNFNYCQADIEVTIRCEEQCDHCKEYYEPLEEERGDYNYLEEENNLVRKLFSLEDVIEFSLKHKMEVMRGGDYMYELYIDGKGAYSASLTFMGAVVEGVIAYKERYDS